MLVTLIWSDPTEHTVICCNFEDFNVFSCFQAIDTQICVLEIKEIHFHLLEQSNSEFDMIFYVFFQDVAEQFKQISKSKISSFTLSRYHQKYFP